MADGCPERSPAIVGHRPLSFAHSGHTPQNVTSASSIAKPCATPASRQGDAPTTQSMSSIRPQRRHTTWWWLSPTRTSCPAGSIRRRSPAWVSAARLSYTACTDTSGILRPTASASAWRIAVTASSTRRRGPVARSPASLNCAAASMRSTLPLIWNDSRLGRGASLTLRRKSHVGILAPVDFYIQERYMSLLRRRICSVTRICLAAHARTGY